MKMVKLPNSETPITDLPDREELVGILQRALNECDDSALKNNNSNNNMPHLAQYGRRHSADSHPVEASDVFSAPHEEPLEGDAVRRRLPPARQKSCREFSFGKNSNSGSPKMNKNVVIPRRSSMCGPYPAYFSSGLKNKPGMMLSTSPNAQPAKRFSLSNYDDDNNASATPSTQQQKPADFETISQSQPMDTSVSAAADAGAAAARSFLLQALSGGGAQSGKDRTASSPLSFLGDSLVGAQQQPQQQPSHQQQSAQQQQPQQVVNRRSSVGPGGGGACYNPPTSFTLSSASAATRNALTEYHRNAIVAQQQQTGRRSSDSVPPPPVYRSTFDRRLSAPFDFDHASSSSPYNAPLDRRDSQRSIQTPPSPQQAGGPIRRSSSITTGATAAVRRNSLSNTAKDVKVHKAGQTKAQRRNSLNNTNKDVILNKDGSEKKRTWKKPKDKPRRPLSAYNLFFKSEREVLIKTLDPLPEPVEEPKPEKGRRKRRHRKTHGKISFADLARNIAEKWKNLDEETRAPFEAQALKEKERYRIELEAWNKKKLEEHDKAQAEAAAAKKEQEQQQQTDGGEAQEQSKEVDVKKQEREEPIKPVAVKSESSTERVEEEQQEPPLQSQESSTSGNNSDDDEAMSEANDKVSESLSSNQTKHSTSRPSKFQPMSSLRLDGSSSMMDELAASIRSSDLKDMDSIVMNQSTFFDEPLPARGNNCSGSITPLPANFAANAGTTTMDASEINQRLADVLNDQDAEVEKLFTSLGTMQGSAMEDAFGLGGDEFMKFDLSSTGVDAATAT